MTKERFYIELLKIKEQVGPEHVGAWKTQLDNQGRTCIAGQMALNITGSALHFPQPWYGTPIEALLMKAVQQNNAGIPWHQIIDEIVPKDFRADEVKAEELEVSA